MLYCQPLVMPVGRKGYDAHYAKPYQNNYQNRIFQMMHTTVSVI